MRLRGNIFLPRRVIMMRLRGNFFLPRRVIMMFLRGNFFFTSQSHHDDFAM